MPTEYRRGRNSRPQGHNSKWRSKGPSGVQSPQWPTVITGALSLEQMKAYQVIYRIKELTAMIRSNQVLPQGSNARSPSPPPVYDDHGRRTNTREQRYKRRLIDERTKLVDIAYNVVPDYQPPEDYKKPTRLQDKYIIPVNDYPDINFVGLLLGPRGNTLRQLQEQSGCKIAIRGRGSVKEGKNAADLPKGATNFEDPLHCLIIADSEEKLEKGLKACEGIVIKAVTSPEGQNDLKRGQLRELAELNGTLREDSRPCSLCGQHGHKRYDCPNREATIPHITCRRCGQVGHITRDCTVPSHSLANLNSMDHNGSYANKRRALHSGQYVNRPNVLSNERDGLNTYSEQDRASRKGLSRFESAGAKNQITTNGIISNGGSESMPTDISNLNDANKYIIYDERVKERPVVGPPGLEQITVTSGKSDSLNDYEREGSITIGSEKSVTLQAPPGLNLTNESDDCEELEEPPQLEGPPGL